MWSREGVPEILQVAGLQHFPFRTLHVRDKVQGWKSRTVYEISTPCREHGLFIVCSCFSTRLPNATQCSHYPQPSGKSTMRYFQTAVIHWQSDFTAFYSSRKCTEITLSRMTAARRHLCIRFCKFRLAAHEC
jgi:hypothetical protein